MSKLMSVLFLSATAWAATDVNDVMKKCDDARRLAGVKATGALATISGTEKREKKFTWWRKLAADGVHYRLLTRFHFPPEIKGEGILFQERGEAEPEVLMYLPAYKKVRRVESSAQSGSFMASEFSFTDVLGAQTADFKYRLQSESAEAWVVESTPASDAVKTRAGYARRVDWIKKTNYVPTASEYYDASGKLVKKLTASDVVEVDAAHHKWLAKKLEMENVVSKKKTTIEFSDVSATEEIPDATFTPRNLEKVL